MSRRKKNKIYTLEDVRHWRELKHDELELEKLKLYAEKEEFEKDIKSGIGKILFYEGILLVGQKLLTSFLKSLVKDKPKKKSSQNKDKDLE